MNTLPQAWNRIVGEPDSILLDLMSEMAEKICGLKPELPEVLDFLTSHRSQFFVNTTVALPVKRARPVNVPQDSTNSKLNVDLFGVPMPLAKLAQAVKAGDDPEFVVIQGKKVVTRDWTDLCRVIVEWLVDSGHLKQSDLPILNSAGRDKYFINRESEHKNPERDGTWLEVRNGYFVDTKYNAPSHVKNLGKTLGALGLSDDDILIKLR